MTDVATEPTTVNTAEDDDTRVDDAVATEDEAAVDDADTTEDEAAVDADADAEPAADADDALEEADAEPAADEMTDAEDAAETDDADESADTAADDAEADSEPADTTDDEPDVEPVDAEGEAQGDDDPVVTADDATEDAATATEEDVATTAESAVATPDLDDRVDTADDLGTVAVAHAVTATADTAILDAGATNPGEPSYAWAPAQPGEPKRRTGLWIGIGAAVATLALVASSLILIAPGTSVGGVGVGLHTQGAAAAAIQGRLDDTVVVLTGAGGDAEVTGADLGASVDADGLAATAFAEHPMWNVTAWFPESTDAAVRVDPEAASSALRAAAPELYVEPVDASLAFDSGSAAYVVTPGVDGAGVDVEAVREALQTAFLAGETRVEIDAPQAAVTPTTPTYVADATADELNRMLDTAGFYVGDERTVPVSRETAASWLTVTPADRGTFAIAADEAAIQSVVDSLAEEVDRETVNATVITDSEGDVLQEVTAGVDGRSLDETSGIASDYAAQLATGSARYELPVTETKFETTALERRIEIDLGAQRTYLYENDKVVHSYAISSGLPGTPTPTGSFRVFAHTSMQDMGAQCYDPTRTDSYCTKDVPWITWFAPDVGFHGAYWHNNFGNRMSHGCVNMPIDVAKYVYDWTPVGTEVWVHN